MIGSGFQFVDKKEIRLKGIKEIILMGDIGCTSLDERSRGVLDKALRIKTDLFFVLGDIVRFGKDEEFIAMLDYCNKRAAAPIFGLVGNHDLPAYGKHLGLASYALILDNFVIMVLDNITSKFEKKNLVFFEEELVKYKDKKFLILFHIPPPTDLAPGHMPQEEWQNLKELLDKHKQRIECLFCAHIHGFREYRLDGYHVFITGGGGAELQDTEKDPLKTHHAVKSCFKDENTVCFEVIKIEI